MGVLDDLFRPFHDLLQWYSTCIRCGEQYLESQVHEVDGRPVCDACLRR